MGIMEGRSQDEITTKYRDLYMPALYTNWKVWPAVQVRASPYILEIRVVKTSSQFVNFKFIPLPFRVPFQSSCGCFWTLYLSLLNSSCVLRCIRINVVGIYHPTVTTRCTLNMILSRHTTENLIAGTKWTTPPVYRLLEGIHYLIDKL
jgi:hypothetical protein